MGHDWDMDSEIWVGRAFLPWYIDSTICLQLPQCLGILGLQRSLWSLPGSVLRLLSDHDG